jgi:hypothetical protein
MQMIKRFLDRRDSLPQVQRHNLAWKIGVPISESMGEDPAILENRPDRYAVSERVLTEILNRANARTGRKLRPQTTLPIPNANSGLPSIVRSPISQKAVSADFGCSGPIIWFESFRVIGNLQATWRAPDPWDETPLSHGV